MNSRTYTIISPTTPRLKFCWAKNPILQENVKPGIINVVKVNSGEEGHSNSIHLEVENWRT